jgi:ATP-dependent helicase/nuclease subunit B
MALVKSLLEAGVSERDIAVAVRSLDRYEDALVRASVQHGVVPDIWTQLRVAQTRPYALVISVCDALATGVVDKHTLLEPLEYRWTPPETDATDSQWPIDSKQVQYMKAILPEDSLTRAKWVNLVQQADHIDGRLSTYLQWLTSVPTPEPETAAAVIGDVVDRYATHGLPETKSADGPALLETETDASAVQRVRKLADQLAAKLGTRLDRPSVEQSWATVGELVTIMATQRPGSRKHTHVRAVDIYEANDMWGLDIPYVIAAGLTAREWPKATGSTLQPECEEQILRGSGEASILAPNTSWTTARDRDHLADTLRAAGRGIIVTRYTETMDGETVHPSPFLRSLETDQLTTTEVQQLRSPERDLPAAITKMLSTDSEADIDD